MTQTFKAPNGATVTIHGEPNMQLVEQALKELYLATRSKKEKAA